MSSKKKTSTKAATRSKKAPAPKVRTDRFVGTASEIATPEELERKPLVVSPKLR